MAKIIVKDLGPVHNCAVDMNQFTILTGAQASGKSTIAKSIYFCRTNGMIRSCLEPEEDGGLIINEVIDGASSEINKQYDELFNIEYGSEACCWSRSEQKRLRTVRRNIF